MTQRAQEKHPTSIESSLYAALDAMGVVYQAQANVGSYVVDALLTGNVVVEALGDFWHCNPAVYPDGPTCETQRLNRSKDRQRAGWFKSRGYRLIGLWETDIKKRGARALLEDALREAC